MTKSCKSLIDHCFKELNLNRVIIKCETRNKASQRIPERLGFCKQGVIKRDSFYNDKYDDHVQYSMFKGEWIKDSE
ncbi:MAG: GNAT family N-acetyltransferase [Ignavibacteria bacterium]|nr:GNAT family N-acetyltransferase [Ignavibacteria bacterium]